MASARRVRSWLAAIFVVALALRLGHLAALRGDVLFDHPPLDEGQYVDQARDLWRGVVEPHAFWQPPGILFALAPLVSCNNGPLRARLVQVLLSSLCPLLAFAVARRFFSTRAALATAAVVALHGVLVFESCELLPPVWATVLDLALLVLLLRAAERQSRAEAFAAGVALGVSALFAATVLPFGAVAAWWLWRRVEPPARRRLVGLFVVGVMLPIAPVTLRNHRVSGEWVLISSNAGINFYIGNHERYPSTVAIRPGRRWTELAHQPDRFGVRGWGARSSWFFRQGLRACAAHPVDATVRLARKLYLFFHGDEIPRDGDVRAAGAASPVLRLLVWPRAHLPDGLLLPLALVGIAAVWPRRRELALLLGFVAAQALVVAAFFVTSRYRAPTLPLLALFAVAGAARLL